MLERAQLLNCGYSDLSLALGRLPEVGCPPEVEPLETGCLERLVLLPLARRTDSGGMNELFDGRILEDILHRDMHEFPTVSVGSTQRVRRWRLLRVRELVRLYVEVLLLPRL